MKANQINALKDTYMTEVEKRDGTKTTLGAYMDYFFENGTSFVTSKDAVVVDEANEMIHCISMNPDGNSQCDYPIKIMSAEFLALQQVSSVLTYENFDKVIDEGFLKTLLSPEKADFLKKWARKIKNHAQQPMEAEPFFKPENEPVLGTKPYTMKDREEFVPKTCVRDTSGKAHYYDTPEDAFKNLKAGGMITLESNVSFTETVELPKDTFIYLSNKIVNSTANPVFRISDGDVTVSGFDISSENTIFEVNGSEEASGSVELYIKVANMHSDDIAVKVTGNDYAYVEVSDTTTITSDSTECAIKLDNPNSEVNINGSVIAKNAESAISNNSGSVYINGKHSEITGKIGILVTGNGYLHVEDGEINSTEKVTSVINPNGRRLMSAPLATRNSAEAIRIEYTDDNKPSVLITGGRFNGKDNAIAAYYNGEINPEFAKEYVSVSAGSFNSEIDDAYLSDFNGKDSYVVEQISDTTWTVVPNYRVIMNGTVKFITFEEAISYAEDNVEASITLLKNCDKCVIPAGKKILLDLSGHNISGDMYGIKVEEGAELTITDTEDSGCVYSTNIDAQNRPAIFNYGTVYIYSGWFGDINDDPTDPNNVAQRGTALNNFGKAFVYGGHFTACDNFTNTEGTGIGYAYAMINNAEDAELTVHNADIYGNMNGCFASNAGVINVLNATCDLRGPKSYYVFYTEAKGTILVSGGNFTKTGNTRKLIYVVPGGKVSIKGGNYDRVIEDAFIENGYKCIADETSENRYVVVPAE